MKGMHGHGRRRRDSAQSQRIAARSNFGDPHSP
jgi:hypothetical protein